MDVAELINEVILNKDADELRDEIIQSHGWTRGLVLGSNPGIFDQNGTLLYLEKSYHPEQDFTYASDLILEMDAAGYGVTINTRDILSGNKRLLMAAVPYGSSGLPGIPSIDIPITEEYSLSTLICRSVCALYLAYVLVRGFSVYQKEIGNGLESSN